MRHKKKIYSEIIYIIAIIFMSLGIALISLSELGLSMVVAPAYIISEKIDGLTFGQAEYMVQGMVFCVFCIIKRKIKPVYFFSFFTGIVYGTLIDIWRNIWGKYMTLIVQNRNFVLGWRSIYFVIGVLSLAFSVSLFYRIYLYSPVYEFFVKGVSKEFGIDVIKFKRAFDASGLIIACILSAVLFQKLIGVGIGTFIMAYFNGIIIDYIGRLVDKNVTIEPYWKNAAKKFEL